MKLNDGQRQTIHDTLPVLGYIQTLQNYLPNVIECLHQPASSVWPVAGCG